MVSPVTQFLQPNTELHRTSKAPSVVTKRPWTNRERVPTPTTSKWGEGTWFEGKGERYRWTGQSSSHEMWHNENPREETGTGKKDDCRATVKGWATMQWAHWASTQKQEELEHQDFFHPASTHSLAGINECPGLAGKEWQQLQYGQRISSGGWPQEYPQGFHGNN